MPLRICNCTSRMAWFILISYKPPPQAPLISLVSVIINILSFVRCYAKNNLICKKCNWLNVYSDWMNKIQIIFGSACRWGTSNFFIFHLKRQMSLEHPYGVSVSCKNLLPPAQSTSVLPSPIKEYGNSDKIIYLYYMYLQNC